MPFFPPYYGAGPTGWVNDIPDGYIFCDWLTDRYRVGSTIYSAFDKSKISILSVTRSGPTAYAPNAAGVLVPFAVDKPRNVAGMGLYVEENYDQIVVSPRDLTNGAWSATNCTPLLDQVGSDGVASAASSVLATANNATILQAITKSSRANFATAYVKRLVGSGAVSMTMDGGATWTALTLTANWAQLSIPVQTLANPSVGFKLATAGDKIAVDFCNIGDGSFPFARTPNGTTTTRGQDLVNLAYAPTAPYWLYAEWVNMAANSSQFGGYGIIVGDTANGNIQELCQNHGGAACSYNGTNSIQQNYPVSTAGTIIKAAVCITTTGRLLSTQGQAAVSDSNTTPALSGIQLGNSANSFGACDTFIRKFAIGTGTKTGAQLQAMST